MAPEAIAAIGRLGEDRRDIGLLAVTSADRLNAGWTAAQRARENGLSMPQPYRAAVGRCPAIAASSRCWTAIPPLWAGWARSRATSSLLGVEHFGQTGSLAELYRHYGIDADGIVAAVEAIAPGGPIRYMVSGIYSLPEHQM